jgi:hypothetical protein
MAAVIEQTQPQSKAAMREASALASLNRRSANVVVRLGCEPKTMTETTGCRSPKARLFDQAETITTETTETSARP